MRFPLSWRQRLVGLGVSLSLLVGAWQLAPPVTAQLYQYCNLCQATVSIGYDASATTVVLTTGHGARWVQTPPYVVTWWNVTDYPDPQNDPNVEFVLVTARSTDTLTVTRQFEGPTASTKNISGKTYAMLPTPTKAYFDNLNTALGAQYLVLAGNAILSNEAVLAGTANQVILTGSTLSLPQSIHTGASPSFADVTVNAGLVSGLFSPSYVTLATNGTHPNERVLTGTANRVSVTDGGVGGAVTLSTPQDLHTAATPTFSNLTLSGGTVGDLFSVPLVTTASSSTLSAESVLTGTADQVLITSGATLGLPQSIATTSTVAFGTLTLTNAATALQVHSDVQGAQLISSYVAGSTTGSLFRLRKARGTLATPLRAQDGDTLGTLGFDGAFAADDATTAGFQRGAAILGVATDTFTSTARGTNLVFQNATDGGTGLVTNLTVNGDGLTLPAGRKIIGTSALNIYANGLASGYLRLATGTVATAVPAGGTEASQTMLHMYGRADSVSSYFNPVLSFNASDGTNLGAAFEIGVEGGWTNAGGFTQDKRLYAWDYAQNSGAGGTIWYLDYFNPTVFHIGDNNTAINLNAEHGWIGASDGYSVTSTMVDNMQMGQDSSGNGWIKNAVGQLVWFSRAGKQISFAPAASTGLATLGVVTISHNSVSTELSQTALTAWGRTDVTNGYYNPVFRMGHTNGTNYPFTYEMGAEGFDVGATGTFSGAFGRWYLWSDADQKNILVHDFIEDAKAFNVGGTPSAQGGYSLNVWGRYSEQASVNDATDQALGALVVGFLNKTDTATRTYHGLSVKPTLATGGTQANTTFNVLNLDTTNTSVVGVTTNLLSAKYGGTARALLTSGGKLFLSANSAAITPIGNGIEIHEADSTGGSVSMYAYASNNNFAQYRAQGTAASKTAVTSTLALGLNGFGGWDGSAWVVGSRIRGFSAENWSGSARGGYLEFDTVAIGSTTLTARAFIEAKGLTIGSGVAGVRSTTNPTNALTIEDGNAPVGTAASIQLYATSGELRVMDAGGNATLLSPHDDATDEWIFLSKNTRTGDVLRIDMEALMTELNRRLGGGYVTRYRDDLTTDLPADQGRSHRRRPAPRVH